MSRTYHLTLLVLLSTAGFSFAQDGSSAPRRVGGPGPDPFDAVFVNTNQVRLLLQLKSIDIETTYGRLTVPIKDVFAVELGMRIPQGAPEKIDAAVRNLASRDEGERMQASRDLVELGPYSYRAVQRASQANDHGMRQRAQDVLDRLRRKFSAVELTRSTEDVIVTPQMKIAGRIPDSFWKAKVEYFGDNTIEIAKLVSLRNTNVVQPLTDVDRIQGTWVVNHIEFGGFREVESMSFTFVKDQVFIGGQGQGRNEPGTFKLGTMDNLKTIDVDVEGEMMLGIYMIEGNQLKMCVVSGNRGRGNPQRPTEFASVPGSEQVLIVMEKRTKE